MNSFMDSMEIKSGDKIAKYIREDLIPKYIQPVLSDEVIIRTDTAGVHIGTIKSRQGREVILLNARRLWKWAGAFTLNAVATQGVDRANSRISVAVPEIELFNACEAIPVIAGIDLSTTEAT